MMGTQNVAAASTIWGPRLGSNHGARVALLVMANIARDKDEFHDGKLKKPKAIYYAGYKPVAIALGLGGTDATQRQCVSRHVSTLVKLGALTMIEHHAPGKNAKYRVNFPLGTVAPKTQVSDEEQLREPSDNSCVSRPRQLREPSETDASTTQLQDENSFYQDQGKDESSSSRGEYSSASVAWARSPRPVSPIDLHLAKVGKRDKRDAS